MLTAMRCMLACPSCTPALLLQAMRCMLPSPSCSSSKQFSELEQEHEELGYRLSLDEAARLRDSSLWEDQEGINHYMQSSVSARDCEADWRTAMQPALGSCSVLLLASVRASMTVGSSP